MDVAIDPRLSHRSGIGSHIAGVAMRQVEHKETGFLLDTADHHHRLAEVRLCMAGRMRQRHEHLLAALLSLAHVILDDRVAAGEPAFGTQPVEHSLGRMALLARNRQVLIQPMIDGRNKCIQLRTSDR